MKLFAINFLISLLWTLLTGVLSVGNLFMGFLLGYLALLPPSVVQCCLNTREDPVKCMPARCGWGSTT